MNQSNSISKVSQLKRLYLAYYEDVPVQKYAAQAIGRDEDTIIRWKNEDTVFAEAILKAKAKFIRKRVLATKAEFALERIMGSVFSPPSQIKLSASIAPSKDLIPQNQHLIDLSVDYLMEATKRQETKVIEGGL